MVSCKTKSLSLLPSIPPPYLTRLSARKFLPISCLRTNRDINPQAPVHIVIIPKFKDGLSGFSKAEERHCKILGRLLYTAKLVAKQEGLDDGFRIVINDGPKGYNSLFSRSICLSHPLGRQMNWLPG